MRLHPEIALLGDHTMSRIRWTLERETERIESLAQEHPEMAESMAAHGWTARGIAWGHLLDGWLNALGFDDEDGRA